MVPSLGAGSERALFPAARTTSRVPGTPFLDLALEFIAARFVDIARRDLPADGLLFATDRACPGEPCAGVASDLELNFGERFSASPARVTTPRACAAAGSPGVRPGLHVGGSPHRAGVVRCLLAASRQGRQRGQDRDKNRGGRFRAGGHCLLWIASDRSIAC